jgi:hypothetical protein
MATLGSKVVFFGGVGAPRDGGVGPIAYAETWEWNGASWAQRTPAHSPPARYGQAMASVGSTVVLFGGALASGALTNDTWTWDGTDWTPHVLAVSPSPRVAASLVTYGSVAILYRGLSDAAHDQDLLIDMWTWDGAKWGLVSKTTPQLQTCFYGVAVGAIGDRLVTAAGNQLFGTTCDDSTYAWNGASWTTLSSSLSGPQITTTAANAIYAYSSATNANVMSKGLFVPTPPAPAAPPPTIDAGSGIVDAGPDVADASDSGACGDGITGPLCGEGTVDGVIGDTFVVYQYVASTHDSCIHDTAWASVQFRIINVPQHWAVKFPQATPLFPGESICHTEIMLSVEGQLRNCCNFP